MVALELDEQFHDPKGSELESLLILLAFSSRFTGWLQQLQASHIYLAAPTRALFIPCGQGRPMLTPGCQGSW